MIYICMSSLSTILLIFYFIYLFDFQIAFKNKESSAFLFVSSPFRYIWYRIIQRWRTFVNFYENTSLEISSPRLLSAMIKVNLSCFQMSKFSWEFRSKTLPTFSKAHFPFLNSLLQHFLSSGVSWTARLRAHLAHSSIFSYESLYKIWGIFKKWIRSLNKSNNVLVSFCRLTSISYQIPLFLKMVWRRNRTN